jgi:hypothetical protein
MKGKKASLKHYWLKLSGHESRCVTCGLIRFMQTGKTVYFYRKMGSIEYTHAPDCKLDEIENYDIKTI